MEVSSNQPTHGAKIEQQIRQGENRRLQQVQAEQRRQAQEAAAQQQRAQQQAHINTEGQATGRIVNTRA